MSMYITCLDLEGVLVPEIWIAFAEASGIPELKRTTRDEPCRRQALLDVARQIGGTCQLRLSHVGPSRIGYIWGHSMPLVKTGDKTAVKSAHWGG